MEFGVYLRPAKTYPQMVDLAQRAEKLGFQGAYINDHIQGFGENVKDEYLEAWTTMTGIGLATSKLRIGQIVLFNSLRNPAFLAKQIATLDIMLAGRFELLIGAGWNAPEYEAYDLMEGGKGMPSAKERVDRFEESLQIIKSMLHNDVTNFDGEYWKIKNAPNIPQPVQKPMRISVGCEKPRMLNITAKYADGLNLPGASYTNNSTIIQQFAMLASKYDKNLSDYFISGFASINLTNSKDETKNLAKPIAERLKISVEEVIRENYIGSAEDLVKKLVNIEKLGMGMLICIFKGEPQNERETIEYFHDNVITQI